MSPRSPTAPPPWRQSSLRQYSAEGQGQSKTGGHCLRLPVEGLDDNLGAGANDRTVGDGVVSIWAPVQPEVDVHRKRELRDSALIIRPIRVIGKLHAPLKTLEGDVITL